MKKFFVLGIGFVFLFPQLSFAAISWNSASGGSFSITIASGTNILCMVSIPTSGTGVITAVSIGGTAGSLYNEFATGGVAGTANSVWTVFSPPTGAQTVSITGSPTDQVEVDCLSGVKQSGFPDTISTSVTGSGLTCTNSITPVAAGAWTITVAGVNRSFSSGTNFTNRGGGGNPLIGDSNGIISGATNVSITQGSSSTFWCVTMSVAPSVTITVVSRPYMRSFWW